MSALPFRNATYPPSDRLTALFSPETHELRAPLPLTDYGSTFRLDTRIRKFYAYPIGFQVLLWISFLTVFTSPL